MRQKKSEDTIPNAQVVTARCVEEVDPQSVKEVVKKSREAQGLPENVEDPEALTRVVALLKS